jgi:hypothetical protein
MIPNYLREVHAARSKYAEAWAHAHVDGDPRRLEWIKFLVADLRAIDPDVGCNGKRGDPRNLSADAINILCDAADSEGRTPGGLPCVVVDVIGSAGARPPYTASNPAPFPTWNVFTTLVEGSGANVDPGGIPVPPPPPSGFPYPDENTKGKAFQARVKRAYMDARRPFPDPNDEDAFRHFMRYGFSAHEMPETQAADKHIAELRAQLGVPPETP